MGKTTRSVNSLVLFGVSNGFVLVAHLTIDRSGRIVLRAIAAKDSSMPNRRGAGRHKIRTTASLGR